MTQEVFITIQPAVGGFVVRYPKSYGSGEDHRIEYVSEVATTVGKAMRAVKRAVTDFSLVQTSKEDSEE
jgi:hypothetical protein